MNKILTFSASAFLAFALMFGVTFVLNDQVVVAAEEQPAVTETKKEEPKKDVYRYTAQAGDTYSQMARKAVQTYGINSKVNLSQAKIIAAETNLTIKAGSPLLDIGQVVEISKADVKEWADKAKDLSKETEALWNEYTAGVDFNTDAVGEAKEIK